MGYSLVYPIYGMVDTPGEDIMSNGPPVDRFQEGYAAGFRAGTQGNDLATTDSGNLTEPVKSAQNPPNNDLRDKINALRKQRDAHQMDEPDYVDGILALLKTDRQQLLDRLLAALPEKTNPGAWEDYGGNDSDYYKDVGFDEALDQCRKIVEGL